MTYRWLQTLNCIYVVQNHKGLLLIWPRAPMQLYKCVSGVCSCCDAFQISGFTWWPLDGVYILTDMIINGYGVFRRIDGKFGF